MLCVSYRGKVWKHSMTGMRTHTNRWIMMEKESLIGKSAVRKILIDLKFCGNGLSNAGQSCQVNSGVITYTSLENQGFSEKRNSTFEN